MEEAPSALYHYTTQCGLLGIVTERSLQASNIQFLNDAAEFSYAVQLLDEVLDELQNVSLKEKIKERLHKNLPAEVYIGAFSERPDVLSLWRGYCTEGGGYSLGFHFSHLESTARTKGFILRKCIYDRSLQEQSVKNFVHDNLVKASHEQELDEGVVSFLQLAPVLKHPAFIEESEWRLISPPLMPGDKRIRFRQGESTIVPYVPFSLAWSRERLSFESVTIGPTPYMTLSEYATRSLLTVNEISCEVVARSMIPYRPW